MFNQILGNKRDKLLSKAKFPVQLRLKNQSNLKSSRQFQQQDRSRMNQLFRIPKNKRNKFKIHDTLSLSTYLHIHKIKILSKFNNFHINMVTSLFSYSRFLIDLICFLFPQEFLFSFMILSEEMYIGINSPNFCNDFINFGNVFIHLRTQIPQKFGKINLFTAKIFLSFLLWIRKNFTDPKVFIWTGKQFLRILPFAT